MKVPCAQFVPFIVVGLSFLKPELSNIQFHNLAMIGSALVLGSKFSLTEITRMWLKEKSISTLSEFISDAKFSIPEMNHLYAQQLLKQYNLDRGYFIIDDTMKHHTKFCKWIHGAQVLFDHAFNTNLKATCIVFLYYNNGNDKAPIKFPICHRIFYKEKINMPWELQKKYAHKKKYTLATEMLEWALSEGFPKSTVLADSWFGVGPFVKELKRLGLSYVIEIKSCMNVQVPSNKPKLTPKGRVAKSQYDLIKLPKHYKNIESSQACGFVANEEKGKKEKVLYHTKISTIRLNSFSDKQRVVESYDPIKKTTKYLLTDQLTWEATKIISAYDCRWVIEEFFRNAKQLTDMEGATIRSEQGVTLTLCLVSWIDSLLHFENYKLCTADKLPKEPLTVPSIIRRAQYENMECFIERIRTDESFVQKWYEVEKKYMNWKRKIKTELVKIKNAADQTENVTA